MSNANTNASTQRPRIFTIPPRADFLATLARAMRTGQLPGTPEASGGEAVASATGNAEGQQAPFPAFAGWRIYLPTRRAARALAAAMLAQAGQGVGAQLLPRILPLGDVDEDELQLAAQAAALEHGGHHAALPPPAIAPLPRLFRLAELMRDWAFSEDAQGWRLAAHLRRHAGAALRLARSLARLIDSFENEEQPLDAIDRLWKDEPLAPERAEHRLAAQHLLAFLARRWPAWLAEQGLTGAAARRAQLIRLEAEWLAANPPAAPVLAAGSTGSMPATAHLLATIARLPTGCVVLPGLDVDMDDESWQALEPGHPQYGMKVLLEEHLQADRREVQVLDPDDGASGAPSARALLLREALRPVETTDRWRQAVRESRQALQDGADGLHLLLAPTRRQEALAIALLMRETLQQPERTCMLITPDRTLARAVRAELARWHIAVDDSAGQPLIDTLSGAFLKLLLEAALHDFAPLHLMALLRHPLACFGMARADCAGAADDLELAVLRPARRFDGLSMLPDMVARRRQVVKEGSGHEHPNVRILSDADWQAVHELADHLREVLQPLCEALGRGAREGRAAELLQCLLQVAEQATTPPEEDCLLWRGEAGEALAMALAEILADADDKAAPAMRPADFVNFLQAELAQRVVRPRHEAHARLSILGLLEARLLRADRVILGGLNEGIWPEVAQNDPWLTRTDRKALHLPVPERRIGLSAHDFAQAAGSSEVWLTCSERIDQQPAEPSRWIVRLQAVLGAAGLDSLLLRERWPLDMAARLDVPATPRGPVSPPRPCPPLHLRPRHISASRVRTLLRDPYAIFARQVLRFVPLDPLSPLPTPALFGIMVHAALEDFIRRWPRDLPDNAAEELFHLFEQKHAEYIGDDAHLMQVRGRLRRMAEAWVKECEQRWRADGALLRSHAESEGALTFDVAGRECRLTARADRIDVLRDGTLRIIDYKTGVLPKRNPASSRYDPQMDLEAAIALQGGFAATGEVHSVRELILARLSGGDEEPLKLENWHVPGRRKNEDRRDVRQRAEDALGGLERLLAGYMDEAQPYLPLDHGERDRRPGDFDHLNRWREWLSLLATDASPDANGD